MSGRPRLRLERTFDATPEEVWELWTTREGVESWMGPEGFTFDVREMDLRPGGELVYAMTATAPDQVEFLAKAGMPLVTEHRFTYVEVVPPRRLVYRDVADFIPGVEPYSVESIVEIDAVDEGVRVVLTFDPMHDDRWTQLATMGRESELRKLAGLLAARE